MGKKDKSKSNKMLDQLEKFWEEENVEALVDFYFEINLTEKQQEIVKLIAFSKKKE